MFRNKYIQVSDGDCFLVCLANLFDDETIVVDNQDIKNDFGISYSNGVKLVELLSLEVDMTLDKVLYLTSSFDKYIPVFEHDADDLPDDYYTVYIVSVESGVEEAVHSMLVFKRNNSDYLNILDPYHRGSTIVSKLELFENYSIVSVEVFEVKSKNAVAFISIDSLSHLLLSI